MNKFQYAVGSALVTAVLAIAPTVHAGSFAKSTDIIDVDVFNFNRGAVLNCVLTDGNTGWNFTKSGDSMTGNAKASASVATGMNSSSTGVAVMDFSNGPVAANFTSSRPMCQRGCGKPTMFMKGNTAIALDVISVDVFNLNKGFVMNMVGTFANTGHNMTLGKGADSLTGNAHANASVSTTLNENTTSVAVVEGGFGPLAIKSKSPKTRCNTQSGPSLAMATDITSVNVVNVNMGMVFNDVGTSANTGGNVTISMDKPSCGLTQCGCDRRKCGRDETTSDTGNAVASATVESTVNTNTTNVMVADMTSGPVAANGVGSTCGVNIPCGPEVAGGTTAVNSGNGVAVAMDTTSVDVVNANSAVVTNTVTTDANTGGNMTMGDHADSNTGNANASSTVTNTVNSNSTTVVIVGGGL